MQEIPTGAVIFLFYSLKADRGRGVKELLRILRDLFSGNGRGHKALHDCLSTTGFDHARTVRYINHLYRSEPAVSEADTE